MDNKIYLVKKFIDKEYISINYAFSTLEKAKHYKAELEKNLRGITIFENKTLYYTIEELEVH